MVNKYPQIHVLCSQIFLKKILGVRLSFFSRSIFLRAVSEGGRRNQKKTHVQTETIVLLPKRTSRRSHVKRHHALAWGHPANILQLEKISRFEYDGRLEVSGTRSSFH